MSIGQMIDLAIGGTPEVGIVNFKLLHSLLHVIVNKLNLTKLRIELDSVDSKKIKNLIENLPKNTKTKIKLTQHSSTTNTSKIKDSSSNSPTDNEKSSGTDILLTDDEHLNNDNETESTVLHVQQMNVDIDQTDETIDDEHIQVVNQTNDIQPISTPIIQHNPNKTKKILRKVTSLHDLVQSVLPSNKNLFENEPRAIPRMWNLLNFTKRIDATEIGIEKLANMLEDLIRQNKEFVQSMEQIENCTCDLSTLKEQLNMVQKQLTTIEMCKKLEQNENIRSLTGYNKSDDEPMVRTKTLQERKIDILDSKMNNVEFQLTAMEQENQKLKDNLANLIEQLRNQNEEILNIARICEQMHTIKLDITKLYDKLNYVILQIDEFHTKLSDIENELKRLNDIKINRDEFYDALSEKADYYLVKQKVPMSDFDTLRESLLKQLQLAFQKLNETELNLKASINDLQMIIDGKMDQDQVNDIERSINDRLKQLQDHLQSLLALHSVDDLAAGTKSKILRNLNCLSCDANVKMNAINDIMVAKLDKMQPTIKPIIDNSESLNTLNLKLDTIRYEQKTDGKLGNRNMNDFEFVLNNTNRNTTTLNEDNQKRISCLRYCGGSHTKITMEQRLKKTIAIRGKS